MNELYVICQDGSIQSVYDPEQPIGWELIENGEAYFYRVMQVGFMPKKCLVRYHSRDPNPPMGNSRIGSSVFACIHVASDDGEPEVSSTAGPC